VEHPNHRLEEAQVEDHRWDRPHPPSHRSEEVLEQAERHPLGGDLDPVEGHPLEEQDLEPPRLLPLRHHLEVETRTTAGLLLLDQATALLLDPILLQNHPVETRLPLAQAAAHPAVQAETRLLLGLVAVHLVEVPLLLAPAQLQNPRVATLLPSDQTVAHPVVPAETLLRSDQVALHRAEAPLLLDPIQVQNQHPMVTLLLLDPPAREHLALAH